MAETSDPVASCAKSHVGSNIAATSARMLTKAGEPMTLVELLAGTGPVVFPQSIAMHSISLSVMPTARPGQAPVTAPSRRAPR